MSYLQELRNQGLTVHQPQELVPRFYAIYTEPEEEGSSIGLNFNAGTAEYPELAFLENKTSHPEIERARLIQLTIGMAQKAFYLAHVEDKRWPEGEDLYRWVEQLEGYFDSGDISTPVGAKLHEIFSENQELFLATLVGHALCKASSEQDIAWDERENGTQLSTNASLWLMTVLSKLHFDLSTSSDESLAVTDLYKDILRSDPEGFQTALARLVELTGLRKDIVNLRVARVDDKIITSLYDNDGWTNEAIPLMERVIGSFALEGLDGSGKTTAMHTLRLSLPDLYILPLAHPESAVFQGAVENIFPDKVDLHNRIKQVGVELIAAREAKDIAKSQMLIAEARNLIAQTLGIGRQLHLAPFQNCLMDRSIFTNIAYSVDAVDMFNKLRELGIPTIIPATIFYLDLPVSLAFERSRKRGEGDLFDQAEFEGYAGRDFRYRLMARLFPEIFELVPTVRIAAWENRAYSPEWIARFIRSKIHGHSEHVPRNSQSSLGF